MIPDSFISIRFGQSVAIRPMANDFPYRIELSAFRVALTVEVLGYGICEVRVVRPILQ